MRRTLALLLAIFMVASLCATNIFATEEAGAGTSTEATENTKPAVAVGTAEEFAAMEADGNYYLTANITLTASYPGVFKGTFDGKDFTVTLSAPMFTELEGATIKNLKTAGEIKVTPYSVEKEVTVPAPTDEDPNATTTETVLELVTSYDVAAVAKLATDSTFVNIANATAFDTTTVAVPTPTDEAPEATTDVNFRYVAGIVALAKGNLTIDGCSNSVAITHDVNHIAGIVAQVEPGEGDVVTIKNCVNTGAMTIPTVKKKSAGIVANLHEADYGPVASAVIDNCVNTADILGGDQIGGVAGWIRVEDAVLTNCVNEGKIASTQNYAGGVFGRVADNNGSSEMTIVKNCVNKGEVQAFQSQAGGIVGYAASPVLFENCSNSGKITFYPTNENGTTSKNVSVGGISGNINAPAYYRYCSNTGVLVSGRTDASNKKYSYAGGISGNCGMGFSALYCTNTGTVTGDYNAGGIVGNAGAKSMRGVHNVMFCQSFGDVTGGNQVGGLVGYAYGTTRDEFALAMYNVVDCNIVNTSTSNTSGLFGYFNCANAILMYNLITGTITIGAGGTKIQAICWNNASTTKTLGQNVVIENYTANYSYQNGEIEPLVGYKAEELVAKANELAGGEYFVKTETGYAVNAFAPAATTEAVAVKTAEEFANMDPLGNYYLDADITLTSTYPIFAGTLDGKGHTVTVSAPMFRELRNATVSNLVIEGAVATGETAANTEADVAAPLALSAIDSTIAGVTNKATVSGIAVAAGVVARTFGIVTIEDCANEGSLAGQTMVGGIVGVGYETILTVKGTTNSGSFDGSVNEVGGIVGRLVGSRVVFEECVNTGVINATAGGARAGGLLGWQNSTFGRCDMTNCINNANVTGCDQVGGLAGWARAFVFVDGVYNTGDVTSMTNYAGGIIARPETDNGTNNYTMVFKNCVNDGKVQGHRQYAGGIVGYCTNNIYFENCYNNGYVTGSYAAMIESCEACSNKVEDHWMMAAGIIASVGGGADFVNCVNTGKIEGTRKTGGIVAHMNSKASAATRNFIGCFNLGDVYNTCAWQQNATSAAAGLVGYANNASPVAFKNCGVLGQIKSETTTASAFAGHLEHAATTFDNCYFGGTLACSVATAEVSGTYLLQYNAAAADLNPDNIKNIYVLDSFNYAFYYHAGDVAVPEGAVTKVADLKSADLLAVLNANAGAEVFFLNAEYDKAPVNHAHNIFSKGDKAPTCVEDGYNAVISCDICYAVLKAGETLPALGHNFPGVATCDNPQYCTVCNAMDFVPHTPGAEPTCTESQNCTVCNTKLKDALGHVEVQSPNSTCQYVKDCSRCGENVKFHYASNKKGTAATCTKDGKTDGATCMWCGYVIKAQEVIPATGHTSVDVAAVEPTCTKAGATAGKKCSTCNTVLEGCEAVPALGHTEEVLAAVAATCTEAGLTEGKKCSVCNEVLVAQEEVAALGHTEVVLEAVAPTTEATGLTEGKKCSVCDEVLVAQEVVEKLAPETTKAPETTEAPEEGGCGGTIGATVALVAVALLAPAGIMLKKKED